MPYFKMLIVNIDELIDNLNHQKFLIESESEDEVLIIPKNPEGIAAAEISKKQTGIAILRYHHHLLKGDLNEKRKILQEIGLEYEKMLKSKPCDPKEIFLKTWSLLNRLCIRHDNEENEKNIAKFSGDGELESWYDEIYQMLLLCKLLSDNIPRMKKVSGLEERLKKDDR
jgi:hypothetical protein